MIAGVGVDLCEIARMERILRDEKFLARYFSPEEREYIRSKRQTAAQTMAGMFAAKEALTKALGTGIVSGALSDIRVLHDAGGAPYYDLRGVYAELAMQRNIVKVHLSISHDGGIAAAFAAAEKEDGDALR